MGKLSNDRVIPNTIQHNTGLLYAFFFYTNSVRPCMISDTYFEVWFHKASSDGGTDLPWTCHCLTLQCTKKYNVRMRIES